MRLFGPETQNTYPNQETLINLRIQQAYELAANILPESGRILDLGCGKGTSTHFLENGKRQIVGLDVNPENIQISQTNNPGENFDFKIYDGKGIPFRSSTFDGILFSHVIEHVHNPLALLKEIRRVLKQESPVCIITPNRKYRVKEGKKPWSIYHVSEYSPEELQEMLTEIFKSVNIMGITGTTPEITQLEHDRIHFGFRILSALRSLMPELLDRRLFDSYRKMAEIKKLPPQTRELSSDYYKLTEVDKDTLDIFAICK